MSHYLGYTPIALAEIPHGNSPVDLYFPMGDFPSRKLVRVYSKNKPLPLERRAQLIEKGVNFLWINSSEVESIPRISGKTLGLELLNSWFKTSNRVLEEQTIICAFQILRRWILKYLPYAYPEWNLLSEAALESPFSTHALRVSVLVTIFALAYENEDLPLLQELSLSGLLHDLGHLSVGVLPFQANTVVARGSNDPNYKAHPNEGIRLLNRHFPKLSEQTKKWIFQHHERFGGGGFPKGLEGYQTDDLSLLLAMADLLDELASGQWDGQRRGLVQAFTKLIELNSDKTFPQWFNPDVLRTVSGWLDSLAIPVTPNSSANSAAA